MEMLQVVFQYLDENGANPQWVDDTLQGRPDLALTASDSPYILIDRPSESKTRPRPAADVLFKIFEPEPTTVYAEVDIWLDASPCLVVEEFQFYLVDPDSLPQILALCFKPLKEFAGMR